MILITKKHTAMSGTTGDLIKQLCQGAAHLRDELAERTELTRRAATSTLKAAMWMALEAEREEGTSSAPAGKEETKGQPVGFGPEKPRNLRGIFYDPEDRIWRVSDEDGLWVYASETLEKAMLYAREVELWH